MKKQLYYLDPNKFLIHMRTQIFSSLWHIVLHFFLHSRNLTPGEVYQLIPMNLNIYFFNRKKGFSTVYKVRIIAINICTISK